MNFLKITIFVLLSFFLFTSKTFSSESDKVDTNPGDFETGSDEDWEPHFEAVRQKLNKQLNEKRR